MEENILLNEDIILVYLKNFVYKENNRDVEKKNKEFSEIISYIIEPIINENTNFNLIN